MFQHFKALVQRKFDVVIKKLQGDGGGEFQTLNSLLFQNGYEKRIFYPYNSAQNGVVERRNRQIVECGLSMLIWAGLPIEY